MPSQGGGRTKPLSPAVTWAPDQQPKQSPPPGILADAIDFETGEFLSIDQGIDPTDAWLITSATCAVERNSGAGAKVDFEIETRKVGGVWLPASGAALTLVTGVQPSMQIHFDPWLEVQPNTDVRMIATSDTNATIVHGTMQGPLVLKAG